MIENDLYTNFVHSKKEKMDYHNMVYVVFAYRVFFMVLLSLVTANAEESMKLVMTIVRL